MFSPLVLGSKYLLYHLRGLNGKGHGIHSPFVFNLVTQVLQDKGQYYCYDSVEKIRQTLLHNHTAITVADLGAGSRKGTLPRRKVSAIAQSALKSPKYARLLFRLCNYLQCKNLLEMGTSLGVTTSYLAHAAAHVVTLEGVPSVAALARENFQKLGLKNIVLLEGNFDDTLPVALQQMPSIDMAYIDGNHRYEPTLAYFQKLLPALHNNSVLVMDDIHWSAEMEAAWEEIKGREEVTLTIDLFFIGLVFFDPSFRQKQHLTIRF